MRREIAKIVLARSSGFCKVCGGVIRDKGALHHRKLKSRGGRDEVSNLIYCHHSCHNLADHSIHSNPSWAKERGFMVPSWGDSANTPMFRPDGMLVILGEDGSITPIKG